MPVFSIFYVEKPTALLSFSNVKEQIKEKYRCSELSSGLYCRVK
jgi:hypothetical protein